MVRLSDSFVAIPSLQASLGVAASKGARCALHVKVGDGEPLVVCCLREGGTESTGLDLIFDSYAEFSVEGPAAVHLTGYYMPEYELGESTPPGDAWCWLGCRTVSAASASGSACGCRPVWLSLWHALLVLHHTHDVTPTSGPEAPGLAGCQLGAVFWHGVASAARTDHAGPPVAKLTTLPGCLPPGSSASICAFMPACFC